MITIKRKSSRHSPVVLTNEYKEKVGKYRFEAVIYGDESGFYEVFKGKKEWLVSRANGTVDDWIVDLEEQISYLNKLKDFLVCVRINEHIEKKNDK